MQPSTELSDTAHIIVWVLGSGCGLTVIIGVIKWLLRRRDSQASVTQAPVGIVTQDPSVVQAPVNNNTFAPTNSVFMSAPAPHSRLRDREVDAYDALGPCMSDVAAKAAALHSLSLTAAQSD